MLIQGAPFAIGLVVLPAQAQGWPSRPIKLVVPTGPGAATDVMARLLSDGISRALKHDDFRLAHSLSF
jgi:tripartite-type tricarboxylate transporter receptor subunit TctC